MTITMTDADLTTGFKAAFRDHPAGVALITAADAEGSVGLTASSVASVAVDPPALVFSVTRATGSAGRILNADTYLVHLLDARHAAVAKEFAVSGGDRFTAEQGWDTLASGEPHLRGVRTALRCKTLQTVPVGSSTLVVAEVLDIYAGASDEPMIYQDRTFRSVGDSL